MDTVGFVTATQISRLIRAPRSAVYRALVDPEAVRRWMVPDGMTSEIHSFEPREGGGFRISLTYDRPTTAGKTSSRTDSFHGRFVELVPDTKVVQVLEFETEDRALLGEMTITYTLVAAPDGTYLTGLHENLPPALDPAANELGWSMSLAKLAALVAPASEQSDVRSGGRAPSSSSDARDRPYATEEDDRS